MHIYVSLLDMFTCVYMHVCNFCVLCVYLGYKKWHAYEPYKYPTRGGTL